MLTVTFILVIAAFIVTIASWYQGKPALHLAVLLLVLVHLLAILPR